MWHNILFYGGLTFLVLLGGAVFLIILSLLRMAQKEDYLVAQNYEAMTRAAAASQGHLGPALAVPAVGGGPSGPRGTPRWEEAQARSKG
ncbi:MAG: hypothetical protein ABIG94_01870 [Pseudomonadota bacterium]